MTAELIPNWDAMKQYRILIVDDEPLARRRMRKGVDRLPFQLVVMEAENGNQALSLAQEKAPDIVLLDIKMPDMDGFELISAFHQVGINPIIIFVTAFDEFAIHAFEREAMDYLLKPAEFPRLQFSIERAITRLSIMSEAQRVEELETMITDLRKHRSAAPSSQSSNDFWIKDKGAVIRVEIERIIAVLAERDYVRFYLPERTLLMRNALSNVEEKLPRHQFIRIHRSSIINVQQIDKITHSTNNSQKLVLKTGLELPIGRSYRKTVQRLMESQNPHRPSS